MSKHSGQALPATIVELFDGTGLEHKVGPTALLIATEPDGWPRLALLSVGEVLAASAMEIRLALYPSSGTTHALTASGRALLAVVMDEAAYKIRLQAQRVAAPEGDPLAFFIARVAAVDEDRVGYASITSGITYELLDERPALTRWQQQIAHLREVSS